MPDVRWRRNSQIVFIVFKSGTAPSETRFRSQEPVSPNELTGAADALYEERRITLSPMLTTPPRSTRA